mmetsp:Transcript_59737/g.128722  ORF Transcript_59737/g.128722 Transcript_59737/m.128722 type:complete len:506 (-) Transcript_59737:78-1595(-)
MATAWAFRPGSGHAFRHPQVSSDSQMRGIASVPHPRGVYTPQPPGFRLPGTKSPPVPQAGSANMFGSPGHAMRLGTNGGSRTAHDIEVVLRGRGGPGGSSTSYLHDTEPVEKRLRSVDNPVRTSVTVATVAPAPRVVKPLEQREQADPICSEPAADQQPVLPAKQLSDKSPVADTSPRAERLASAQAEKRVSAAKLRPRPRSPDKVVGSRATGLREASPAARPEEGKEDRSISPTRAPARGTSPVAVPASGAQEKGAGCGDESAVDGMSMEQLQAALVQARSATAEVEARRVAEKESSRQATFQLSKMKKKLQQAGEEICTLREENTSLKETLAEARSQLSRARVLTRQASRPVVQAPENKRSPRPKRENAQAKQSSSAAPPSQSGQQLVNAEDQLRSHWKQHATLLSDLEAVYADAEVDVMLLGANSSPRSETVRQAVQTLIQAGKARTAEDRKWLQQEAARSDVLRPLQHHWQTQEQERQSRLFIEMQSLQDIDQPMADLINA